MLETRWSKPGAGYDRIGSVFERQTLDNGKKRTTLCQDEMALKGFLKAEVDVGKTGQAVISLPYTSFEFFDRASGKMAVTAGEYEVLHGNSSDAKDLKAVKVTIQ